MSKVYEVSGDTTEWEDILIKKRITTKIDVLLSKGLNPEDFLEEEAAPAPEEESREAQLAYASVEELDELEDDDEFVDSRALNEYRQQRLKELQEQRVKSRFGDVVEISKDEWVREVTECSNTCWVVIHLYQDSVVECNLIDEALMRLAPRFPYIKFLKIRATSAVENWPERNLPTLFLYKDGSLQEQLMTLKSVGGKGMKVEDLEWWLVKKNVVTTSELDEDPREGADSSSRKTVTRFAGARADRDSDAEDSS